MNKRRSSVNYETTYRGVNVTENEISEKRVTLTGIFLRVKLFCVIL